MSVPSEIKCAFCGYEQAKVIFREGRYYVYCIKGCPEYLLKEHHFIKGK